MLSSAYPAWRPGEASAELWARMLQPLDARATGLFIQEVIRTRPGPYPPSIAEITQGSRAREERAKPKALEAPVDWDKGRRAFEEIRAKIEEVGRIGH